MEISYAKVMTPVGKRLYFRSSVELDDPRNPEPFDMENRELVMNRSDGLRQVIPFDELVIRREDGGDEVASYFIFLTTKTTQPGDVNIFYPCSTVLVSDARSPVDASIISMDIFSMMLVNTGITGENSSKE